jgi:predicted nucleic acid-binding protein
VIVVIIDTDIISCLAKIKKFHLLQKLFREAQFIIPQRVYEEIIRAKKEGYGFVDYALRLINDRILDLTSLTSDEILKIKELDENLNLHFGEIEATVLALRKNAILLSNDSQVKKEIERLNLGIEVFNLEDIISTLIDVGELTSESDIKQLIEEIETKDRMLIRNKGYLLQKVSKG